MNQLKKIGSAFIVFILLMVGATSVAANEFNFSVNPILPENQVDPNVGYYYLRLGSGEKQTLSVELSNQTDQPVKVKMAISSATTNLNGVVEYNPNKIKPDSSLKYNIEDYVQAPEKIELPAKSIQKVDLQVTMPDKAFDGVMAGGITFVEEDKPNDEKQSGDKGISIENKFQFVVGLLMQQNDKAVAPELKMLDVFPAQVNYRNVVNANFQNSAKTYLKNMVVDASVTKKGKDKVLYQTQKDLMTMAPNSNFDFPMSLDGNKFKPGKYTYSAEVYGQRDADGKFTYGKDDKGQPVHYRYQWKFKKDFTITGSKASKLNVKDVTVKPDHNWIYWLIGIILAISGGAFAFWKWRKKEEQTEAEVE